MSDMLNFQVYGQMKKGEQKLFKLLLSYILNTVILSISECNL